MHWLVYYCDLVKAGCQNSQQAHRLANSSIALPAWMLQGRQMAAIQLDSIMKLVRKLLVGHTRSISDPVLRWRDFRLTTSSILSVNICCLWRVRLLCTSPCGIPRLPQRPFIRGPHDANPLPIAPNEVVNKQWYCAWSLYYTHEQIWQQSDNETTRILISALKKDQNSCFWTFVVHFAIECELTPKK